MSTLRIAQWIGCTEAEGPHRRAAVWVQGCSIRCPGCCNPELFAARGPSVPVSELIARCRQARHEGVEGLTVVGGEPLDQLDGLAVLCEGAASLGLGVIVFTGYTLAEAQALAGFEHVWRSLDTLVDGRFEAARLEPSGGRRLIGSLNQGLLHRTARYADPELWRRADQPLELRIDAQGAISAVGTPEDVHTLRIWAGRTDSL